MESMHKDSLVCVSVDVSALIISHPLAFEGWIARGSWKSTEIFISDEGGGVEQVHKFPYFYMDPDSLWVQQ